MNDLKDRHVLIAGASGALAQSVGKALVARGARVSGVDHHDSVHARVKSMGGSASFVASLTVQSAVESAFESAEHTLGDLWAVVHVAGGWAGGHSVARTDPSVFETMIDANLRTTFVVAQAAMKRLVAHGGGRVVTTGAITAAQGSGLSGAAAYNASKAAVISLTRALAEEGLAHGVLANCIAPGTMDTPGNRHSMPDADASLWVPTEAVARAVCELCSPGSQANGSVVTFPARG